MKDDRHKPIKRTGARDTLIFVVLGLVLYLGWQAYGVWTCNSAGGEMLWFGYELKCYFNFNTQ